MMPESFQTSVSQSTIPPILTVVVICFNDAIRLPNAVSSVLAQTEGNLEVIIVDDYSQDATPEVSQRLAEQDSRVRVHRHFENSGGCGAPRNTGLSLARSKYVMFLDSDDELTPHAAELLLAAAERDGSDIIAGGMQRHHIAGGQTESWYPRLYSSEQYLASLTDRPGLVHDTVATNKLYRTDFFERTALKFPVGMLYEDVVFTAQALSNARGISIIPDLVYIWMVYPNDQRQTITNQRTEQRNILDRFLAVRRVRDIYGAQPASVRIQADIKALRHHLMLYVNDVLVMDDKTAALLVHEGASVIAGIESGAISSFSPTERAMFAAVLGRDFALLRTLVEGRDKNILPGIAARHDGVICWSFPGHPLPDDEVTEALLDFSAFADQTPLPKELVVKARITSFAKLTDGPRLRGTFNVNTHENAPPPAFLLRQQGPRVHGEETPITFTQRTRFGWMWEATLPSLKRDSKMGASPVRLEVAPRDDSLGFLSPLSPAPYRVYAAVGLRIHGPSASILGRFLGDRWENLPDQDGELEFRIRSGKLGQIARLLLRRLRGSGTL